MLNVDTLYHLPAPARRVLYFGLQRLIGSHIGARWRELKSWEKLSANQLSLKVETRLERLLTTATTCSAYFRNLGPPRQHGESARQYLRRFPVLTREIIRERFTELVADSLRSQITSTASVSAQRYDWLVVKSGGTTGVPATVVHDATFRDWGRATRLYALEQCGFPLGTRYFRLWGSEQDLLQQREKLDRRVLRNLLGEIPLNAFRAKETELRQHWQTMWSHPEIQHLMAYVDAAVSLA